MKEDLKGQMFGGYLAVRREGSGWLCRCGCGAERVMDRCSVMAARREGRMCRNCAQRGKVDLVGKKFGRLVVQKRDVSAGGKARWLCACECGGSLLVRTAELRNGSVLSCGCSRVKDRSMVALEGKRFGALVALGTMGSAKNGAKMWKCKCDCGKDVEVASVDLRSGNVRSCGCGMGKKYIGVDGHAFDSYIEALFYLRELKVRGRRFLYDGSYPGMGRFRYDFFLPDESTYVELTAYNESWREWEGYRRVIERKRRHVEDVLGARFVFLSRKCSREEVAFVRSMAHFSRRKAA